MLSGNAPAHNASLAHHHGANGARTIFKSALSITSSRNWREPSRAAVGQKSIRLHHVFPLGPFARVDRRS